MRTYEPIDGDLARTCHKLRVACMQDLTSLFFFACHCYISNHWALICHQYNYLLLLQMYYAWSATMGEFSDLGAVMRITELQAARAGCCGKSSIPLLMSHGTPQSSIRRRHNQLRAAYKIGVGLGKDMVDGSPVLACFVVVVESMHGHQPTLILLPHTVHEMQSATAAAPAFG